MAEREHVDVAVVGGGIIGLAVAWRARQRGLSVALLDRGATGGGASHVAAGMLAAVAEVEFGAVGRRQLALALRSAELWPAFAAELSAASGIELELRTGGTLLLARDADEARELERAFDLRRSLGLAVTRLRAGQARELEPALAPTLRLGLLAPDDRSVDPRPVLAALRRACELEGVQVREGAPVERVLMAQEGRVGGVGLAGGEQLRAGRVVLAAGAWLRDIAGLPEWARIPVRPVKGQIMRLRDPAGAGLLTRTLRFGGGYLVPRGDGRYVLGATMEERGFGLGTTAGGVHQLLADAHELVPGVAELEIEELSAGLRPGTPDNAPVLGECAVRGLLWAAGHHRNGILLAPLTAQLLADLLAGAPPADPEHLRTCSPTRFRGDAVVNPSQPPVGALAR